jgi:hypothetical protein
VSSAHAPLADERKSKAVKILTDDVLIMNFFSVRCSLRFQPTCCETLIRELISYFRKYEVRFGHKPAKSVALWFVFNSGNRGT